MTGRLSAKAALITAAGQGIGRASALRFASEGAQVWATDINKDALDALAAERPEIKPRLLDVRSTTAVWRYETWRPQRLLAAGPRAAEG